MRLYLDGPAWEADYFISNEKDAAWRANGRYIDQMFMDSAVSAGFCDGTAPATLHGRIPGCDRTMLLENSLIGEPYLGRNLEHSRWSERYSWGFRTRFSLPSEMAQAKRLTLVLRGIDYSAEIYLNGKHIASHTGAFIPVKLDITEAVVRDGENLLALVFAPLPQAMPSHKSSEPAEFAYYHRSQMSWGWDWMRAMVTTGITDHVWLESNNDITIEDLFFRTKGTHVTLRMEASAEHDGEYPLAVSLAPENHTGSPFAATYKCSLTAGNNIITQKFEFPEASFWYPNGYGAQPLYTLKVTLGDAEYTHLVGFRNIAMRRNPDSPEDAYDQTFVVNGKAIFARGLNWVPLNLMPGRTDGCSYETLVRLAAEAGFNLMRIWGGGVIEPDEFYQCCDRYGIMVWQEFMHSCSNYPDDDEYLAFKRTEGEAILKRLRNHVSLSLICGGNEMQYYGLKADCRLLKQYGELAHELTPDLAYHLSCPDLSRNGERNHGPWSVQTHKTYNEHFRLLASEVGCSGMTQLESIRQFIPPSEIAAFPHGQSWKYHFFMTSGQHDIKRQLEPFAVKDLVWGVQNPFQVSKAFLRDFGANANAHSDYVRKHLHQNGQKGQEHPTDFGHTTLAQTIQASMLRQADVLRYFMSHYRALFPRATGCFIWQYNEPWPTFAYSIVDYYARPKMAYYTLKRANAPALLMVEDEDIVVPDGQYAGKILLVADTPQKALTASVRIMDMRGKIFFEGVYPHADTEGTTELASFTCDCRDAAGGMLLLEIRLTDSDGKTVWQDEQLRGIPDFKQAFTLPQCDISVEAKLLEGNRIAVTLANRSEWAALNIRLTAPDKAPAELSWQDNFISIAPGGTRETTLHYTGDAPSTIAISGWNAQERGITLQ